VHNTGQNTPVSVSCLARTAEWSVALILQLLAYYVVNIHKLRADLMASSTLDRK